MNSALLSRATVHVLRSLSDDDMLALIARAARCCRPRRCRARAPRLIGYADGDARRLLNAYENLVAMLRAGGADRRGHAREIARRAAAPLRQGRRAVLRHHLGAAQGGARQRPRTRRCTGSCACSMAASTRATRRAASCAWPARTSAWRPARAAPCARRRRDLRAPRLAGGRADAAQAVVYLAVAPKSNAVYTAYKAARAPSSRPTARGRCRCTCAMRRRG